MKKLLLAATLTLTAAPAMAYDSDFCTQYYTATKVIMEIRQMGSPIVEVMKVTKDDAVLKKATIKAYSRPIWSSDKRKAEEVEEFASEYFIGCLRAYGEDI